MASTKNKLNALTLIFFYRDNIPECQITRKILYKNLDIYLDDVTIREINFDQNKEICDAYRVYGVPTLLISKSNKILKRYSGVLTYGETTGLLGEIIKRS